MISQTQAAWGGSFDDSAVAYACAVGSGAQASTLETDKQWWLAIPTSAHIQTRSFDLDGFEGNSTESLGFTDEEERNNSVEVGGTKARLEKRRRKSHGRHGHRHHQGRKGKKPHHKTPHHPGHPSGGLSNSYYIIPYVEFFFQISNLAPH